MPHFTDRVDAGRKLAQELSDYADRDDVVVLGLPRGGVPVAFEVAQTLDAPLDVFVVRKLGVPGREELAMGAIGSGGVRVLNDDVVRALNIPDRVIETVAAEEQVELERREHIYRGARSRVELRDRVVILVDDGLATGASMRAAVRALRQQEPKSIVVAVPTAPAETCAEFEQLVDEAVCVVTPRFFLGVGGSYQDFSQTSNEEVRRLLERART